MLCKAKCCFKPWVGSKCAVVYAPKRMLVVRRVDNDYIRTNVMADYLDKLSTDVNYISHVEDELEDNQWQYIQACIVLGILVYMFLTNWSDKRE